jgi:hypothetical protein
MQESNVFDSSLKKDKHLYEWTLCVCKVNDVMVEI